MSAILMYHLLGESPPPDVHPCLVVPAGEFRDQMETLTSLGLQSVISEEYDERLRLGALSSRIWITFDDGRLDNFEVAFPILRETGHRATFFVTVEPCLRGDPDHIPLSALREMVEGGMEIASHSLTHPRLAKIDEAEMRREVGDSRRRLEDALGTEVRAFCYPYGNWSPAVIGAVREAGYRLAASTIRDNRNTEDDRWRLRRVMVQPGRTGLRFRYSLSWLYHALHARKNRRRWGSL